MREIKLHKKYVIARMLGGLGNQFFIIAFAYSVAKHTGRELLIDTSVYDNYKIRNFELENVEIFKYIKNIKTVKSVFNNYYIYRILQEIYHVFQFVSKNTMPENHSKLLNWVLKLTEKFGLYFSFVSDNELPIYNGNNNICIYGYFQSEKYFENYKKDIKKLLKVSAEPTGKEINLLNDIKNDNSVALSIRIGNDYTKSRSLNVCDENYYYRGMDFIASKVHNPVFYVFSDDIKLIKEKFHFKYNVVYIEGFEVYQSLRLMYHCKHFVISNSSFSWWGAYLSENEQSIVVVPDRWSNDFDFNQIYFKNMIKIPAF